MGKENNKIPTFEEFYCRYYKEALGYVKKKINNIQDAEDLVCNAFLYCYDHYSNYDPEKASLATWLYLVVNSRVKNYYRDHKEHVELELLENVLPTEGTEMEQAMVLDEERNILAKAISTLPERDQAVVVLKYFYDKNSNEIADYLGLTSVNVRVILARAMSKLEKYCKERGIEGV